MQIYILSGGSAFTSLEECGHFSKDYADISRQLLKFANEFDGTIRLMSLAPGIYYFKIS